VAAGDQLLVNQTGNADGSSKLVALTPGSAICPTLCETAANVPNDTLVAFDFSGTVFAPFVSDTLTFTGNYFCLCVLTPAATPPASSGALTIVGGAITAPDPTATPVPELLPPWPLQAMDGKRESLKFDFELIWCGNPNCTALTDTNQDITFSIRGNDLPHSVTTLSQSQIAKIKSAALSAFQTAFARYNVHVGTGREGTNTAFIVGDSILGACAGSEGNIINISRIYYTENMAQAQYALNQTNGTPTDSLLQAIGAGIGNNAAHEIGHQLKNRFLTSGIVGGGLWMDNNSVDTYNGGSCDGSKAPWVYTGIGTDANKTPIHWEDAADQSWANILGLKR
jgi:hypothetical protein